MNETVQLCRNQIFESPHQTHAIDSLADLSSHPLLMDLSPLSLIRVTGEDAENFLQGQLSNDLSRLDENTCQLHAYCNPKGRILGIIRIMRHEEGFWLMMPEEIAAKLTPRLKMFVLRAKVQIEPEEQKIAVAISGTAHEKSLPSTFRVYEVEGILARQIVIAPAADKTADFFKTGEWHYWDHSLWRLLDIYSGIPQIYSQTAEEFIPQMINFDLVNGVSFQKGCYPGQEIVARLRYLGKLKQRMLIGKVEIASLTAGDEIYHPDKPNQKSGLVVDAIKTGENQYALTAMVPANLVLDGELSVGSTDGPLIERHALPYDIPADKQPGKVSK